jgi:predicted phage tail protein
MLRKIKLYGQLAKFIGRRVLEADVATAAEAVRMLVANFPGLEQHMADQYYRVTVGTYDLAWMRSTIQPVSRTSRSCR